MPWNPFAKKSKADEFETLFREACTRNGVPVVRIAGDQATVLKAGEPSTIFLANVRPTTMNASARERPAMLDRFIRASMSAPSDEGASLNDVRDRLMPRVGPPFAPTMQEIPPFCVLLPERPEEMKTALDPPHDKVIIPATTALHVNVVVDEEMTVWYVRQKHLDAWKTTLDELYPIALNNLRRRSSPDRLQRVEKLPNLLTYETGDSYDAARILILRDIVKPWPQEGVIVAIPVRDLLLCVRLDSLEAIRTMNPMFAFAHDLWTRQGYAITGQPIWFDGTTWEYVPVRIEPGTIGVFAQDRFVQAMNRLESPTAT